MKTIALLFFASLAFLMQAQTVSTIAEGLFFDGLGLSSKGDVYCSNYQGDKVYKYELETGQVSVFASGLVNPNGIGVTPEDNIYICEAGNGKIHVLSENGLVMYSIAGLNNPTGIKYSTEEESLLWVSYNQNSLNILDPTTNETEVLYLGAPLNGPSGIAFIDDQIFISNYNDRKIFRLEDDDSLTEIAQLPGTAAQYNYMGFLTAKGGYLYGTQLGEHRIYRVDPINGEVSLFAGGEIGEVDGDIEDATFNFPNGILGDEGNNRIYVSEVGTSNLRIIEGINVKVTEPAQGSINIEVFPNPTQNHLNIKASNISADQFIIKLYSAEGKLLFHENGMVEAGLINTVIDTDSWGKAPVPAYMEMQLDKLTITRKILKL